MDFDRATFIFEFRPDKWMGREEWQEKVALFFKLAKAFQFNEGRATMTVMYDTQDD